MLRPTYDAQVRSFSPSVSLPFGEASGGVKDPLNGTQFNVAAGSALYGQASSLPGRKALSLTSDVLLKADDAAVGNFSWDTPFWALLRCKVQFRRQNFTRAVLFSKGAFVPDGNFDANAGTGYIALLHWNDDYGCTLEFQMKSGGSYRFARSHLDLTDGNTFDLVFVYPGPGDRTSPASASNLGQDLQIYINGYFEGDIYGGGSPGSTAMDLSGYHLTLNGDEAGIAAASGQRNTFPLMFEHFAIGSGPITEEWLSAPVALSAGYRQFLPKPSVPVNIIHDNDGADDTDNLNCAAMLCRLHQLGYVKLLGYNCTQLTDSGAAATQFLLRVAGLSHIPASASMPPAWPGALQGSSIGLAPLTDYSSNFKTLTNMMGDVRMYRTALAKATGKVHIVCGGAARGIYNLMTSPADDISPLTGAELFAAKVAAVHKQGEVGGNDYNTAQDAAGMQYVYDHNGSVPVFVYANVATVIVTGPGASISRGKHDPLGNCLIAAGADYRPSWDLEPAVGAFAFDTFWTIASSGTVTNAQFDPTTGGNHHKVAERPEMRVKMKLLMDSLIDFDPKPRRSLSQFGL